MFSLKQENKNLIKINDIINHIGEYNLWKYYCRNFQDINKSFKSELYNDKNPSCRIYLNNSGKLLYKDFGNSDKSYSIIDYIILKYSCSFKEVVNIIKNDFKLNDLNNNLLPINKNYLLGNEKSLKSLKKAKITIIKQEFTLEDIKYWEKYHINIELLNKFEVKSCKVVFINNNDQITNFIYNNTNPIYGWEEYDLKLNFIGYKIYLPYQKKHLKWRTNADYTIIQGIKQLDYKSDTLIITKSRKDIMVLKVLGFEAISLASENNVLLPEVLNYFRSKYKNIISLYDNDVDGIKYANKLNDLYNIKPIFVDHYKDISDYIEYNDLIKTKEMINNKLNE